MPTPSQADAKSASPSVQQNGHAIVTISDGKKLIVPTLVGLPMRKVIETASAAGLNIEIVGSGTARAQAPAPGTKVPNGTKIVVHCSY
jgi:cell division protein FtsI (penicillin-binding protein 3)